MELKGHGQEYVAAILEGGRMMPTLGNSLQSRTFVQSRRLFALAILASTSLTAPALGAEFPAVIPLSSLNGANGFRLDGVAAGDNSGLPAASAGDVNGDGFDDVILGVPGADPHGDGSGSSYVVFGKASGFGAGIDLSSLDGANGFRLDGAAAFEFAGHSAASAGDVNGDGFADVIVGAPGAGGTGRSYVVFGKAQAFAATKKLSTLNGANGFRLDGIALNEGCGISAAGAGDVNGDGFADMIVGADFAGQNGYVSGSSYVVFGKGSGFAPSIDLSSLDGGNGFRLDGAEAYDQSGRSVAGAGDVNGDGFADVIVGAVGADPHGTYSGSAYVVFGKAAGFPATIDLASLDGSNGFRLDGEAAFGPVGASVSGAGDVNGDGFADVTGFGGWVVFGKRSGFAPAIDLSALDGSNGFRVAAVPYGTGAAAGDVNGDGFADVIVGAGDPGGPGKSYVVFGKASGFGATVNPSVLNGSNGFRLDGVAVGDYAGSSIASAGDVNGDGFADPIVGAPGADPHGSSSGSSYVVFGRPPNTARTRVGAAADQYISGGAFADTLRGLGGDDALEGRGGGDDLVGGAADDTASYLHAPAGVRASLADPASNTGSARGDSYTAIENLTGSRFADTLTGDALPNRLTGARGPDVLNGLGGADLFVLTSARDSPVGAARDRIHGFNAGSASTFVDRIDLSAIDAKTGPGNQAFTWIGTAAFSRTKGELRLRQAGTTAIVAGDVNGDAVADFEIALLNFTNLATLTAIDFRR
jgi:hypothetical protein